MSAGVYILWDWNGTLLDDTGAAHAALNRMLADRRLPPITLEYFRDHFAFPARQFYEQLGMRVIDSEWDALAREYHDRYRETSCALNAEAVAALEFARRAGARQSVLSAHRQDLLDVAIRDYGIADYFEFVWGVDNLDGASKLDRARELLAHLDATGAAAGRRIVMIGDALHDLEVARALGFDCVLCSQGSHSHARLAAVAPTGRTLLEVVRMALEI